MPRTAPSERHPSHAARLHDDVLADALDLGYPRFTHLEWLLDRIEGRERRAT
jgi:hypothetical protein